MKYLKIIYRISLTVFISSVLLVILKYNLYNYLETLRNIPPYTLTLRIDGSNKFEIPLYKDKEFRKIVSNYILENKCDKLEFSIQDLDETKENIYLNCGVPESYVFDLKNKKIKNLKSETKSWDKFIYRVRKLLEMKYPSFIIEEIDFNAGAYDIKEREIIGHFNTSSFGLVDIKINNNEIEGLMNYPMKYDEVYENEQYKLDPTKKLIAFTYDDGPSIYDKDLIEVLQNTHSGATFFEVGNRMNEYKPVMDFMKMNNIEVGNHSFNHKVLSLLPKKDALNEVMNVNKLYNSLENKNLELFRPPYGDYNKEIVDTVNMPIILWSIDTLDWKTKNEKKIYQEIMKDPKDGDIVLMHSLYEESLKATKKSIKELYKKGFIVVSVGDLFRYRNIDLTPGKIYHCANCGRNYP